MPEQTPRLGTNPEPPSVMGPVRPRERIETIDILRGFALFGVLVANMADYSWSGQPVVLTWTGLGDRTVVWFIALLVEGKFFSLFSFLFGLGFALQMGRAEARGAHFFPLYRRRLFVLLLIGLAHALFLGEGDILHVYAVLGFVLLLFRARSPRTIVRWAIIALLIPVVFWAAVGFHRGQQRNRPERVAERRAAAEQAFRAVSQATYGEMTAKNAERLYRRWTRPGFYLGTVPRYYLMFLLGLYAGRRRIFEDLPAHLPFIRKVMWWGLGLGIVGGLGWVLMVVLHREVSNIQLYNLSQLSKLPFPTAFLGVVLVVIQRPALCLFYASSIILLAQRAAWKKCLAPLAAVGRMALSNYLFQSLVFTTFFYSYGLGLYGKLGPALLSVLSVFIFALQILLSRWWLRRFRFGPAEWLWRTLTYGKLQPMRVSQPAA